MFDPTVFDNLKTVLEGAVYDLDLAGEIVVTDRRDMVDLARFSRTYTIAFCLSSDKERTISCSIQLAMDLEQIAQELLQRAARPGCELAVMFSLPIRRYATCSLIESELHRIWGEKRIIRQTLRHDFHHEQPAYYTNEITIEFGRPIYEDNIDDLQAMVPYMLDSLEQLQRFYQM